MVAREGDLWYPHMSIVVVDVVDTISAYRIQPLNVKRHQRKVPAGFHPAFRAPMRGEQGGGKKDQ